MNLESGKSAANPPKGPTVLTVTLSPAFKLVFCSVLGLTVLAMLVACCIVGLTRGRSLSPQENILFDLGTSTFKLGFGAIIGLMGGKAL